MVLVRDELVMVLGERGASGGFGIVHFWKVLTGNVEVVIATKTWVKAQID